MDSAKHGQKSAVHGDKPRAGGMSRFVVPLIVLLVVAGIGVAVYLSMKSNKEPAEEISKEVRKDISKKPKKSKKSSSRPSSVKKEKTDAPAQQETTEPPKESWLGQPVVKHDYRTNDTIVVETIYTADGKMHKYYHDERENALPTGADQILAMMTENNGGYGAPPLPAVTDFGSDFAAALKKPIEILDTDSDAVKELKGRVIDARKEMLELVAQGMSANEVLKEYEKSQMDNATIRLDAVRKVKEFLESGDREGAQMLCDEYNKVLEKAGIMAIELPPQSKSPKERRKNDK